MPLNAKQALNLYESEADRAPRGKLVTNLDLLLGEREYKIEEIVAEAFLRPKMCARYRFIPVLKHLLADARPGENQKPPTTEKELLRRSVALLLELADENWETLPQSWVCVGSALDDKNWDLAREYINDIFKQGGVRKPMLFLKNFSKTKDNQRDWLRFYTLTEEDLAKFKQEKQETLEFINQNDDAAE